MRQPIAVWVLLTLSAARIASGQMSPGKLSEAHSDLDSPLKCASCHAFGKGRVQLNCLECHKEIRTRLDEKRGLHARVVKGSGDQASNDCARCHAEHNGKQHRLVRWKGSRDRFDHREAGWALEGKHAGLECGTCHQPKFFSNNERSILHRSRPERSMLGLSAKCATCHEDRHRGELGQDCARCHALEGWKPASKFTHEMSSFALNGLHTRVACDGCHKPSVVDTTRIAYKNFGFVQYCVACHKDPHGGSLSGGCDSCHSTVGWKHVNLSTRFNHDRTEFPLVGRHELVGCRSCHKTENFRAELLHAKCMDCHADKHAGQFVARAGGECGQCHTERAWVPSRFGPEDHSATRFPLRGGHLNVECRKCHPGTGERVAYHPDSSSCKSCHVDRHAGQFQDSPYLNRCEGCHTDMGWAPSTFTRAPHQKTRFALTGAHVAIACMECHKATPLVDQRRYHFTRLDCEVCHADPHRPTVGREVLMKVSRQQRAQCEECHTTTSWAEAGTFDHDRTGYPLLGRHRGAKCASCHRTDALRAKRPVTFEGAPRECGACHADIHDGQFALKSQVQADCARCHTTANWRSTEFDHQKHSTFSIAGAHERVPCQMCHLRKGEGRGAAGVVYRGTPRDCEGCHQ